MFACPIVGCCSCLIDIRKLINHMLLYHNETDGSTTLKCNIDKCLHVDESMRVLRTPASHKIHVDCVLIDSTLISVYGVKGASALDDAPYFDVNSCLPPDVMF